MLLGPNTTNRYNRIAWTNSERSSLLIFGGIISSLIVFSAVFSYQEQPLRLQLYDEIGLEKKNMTYTQTSKFGIYKATLAVSSSTENVEEIEEIAASYLGTDVQVVDLGCGGKKISVYSLGTDAVALHFVSAERLENDELNVSTWQSHFESLNQDMNKFNAFMHNSISLFTVTLRPVLESLLRENRAIMLRKTTGYSGSESGALGHILLQIAGRVYEFLGPLDYSLLNDYLWPVFDPTLECPDAYSLESLDLEQYIRTYESYTNEAGGKIQEWSKNKGYYPPLFVRASIAAVDSDIEGNVLFADLDRIANIKLTQTRNQRADCTVYQLNAMTRDGVKAPVRYVVNKAANQQLTKELLSVREDDEASVWDVAFYNSYIASVHDEFLTTRSDWSGWDHYLDQHIGIVPLQGTTTEEINRLAETLDTSLNVPVGQRAETTTASNASLHWYTGYRGSMSWEYWLENTALYSTDNRDTICTCLALNSGNLYFHLYNDTCV